MSKKITILLAIICLCWQWTSLASAAEYITHDGRELQLLKEKGSSIYYTSTDSIIRQARKILPKSIPSVTEKRCPSAIR